jgi:hypothetical protein
MFADNQPVFEPPSSSRAQVARVPFDTAEPMAALKARFDAADQAPGNRDPSRCKALLRFPDGTIFWSAKLAIDADGPPAGPGRSSGRELDPASGQDDTSYHYPGTKLGLASEVVPYLVMPGGSFTGETGLAFGDVAVVIYRGKRAAAVVGDGGPVKKIGEGSIRLHAALHPPAPDPCTERDDKGFCRRIRNASIGEDVLCFVFPRSGFSEDLDQSNIEARVTERAFALYDQLRGSARASED